MVKYVKREVFNTVHKKFLINATVKMHVPETERRANDLCGSVIEIECIGTHRSPDTL